jgi:hypothetical protein
MALLTPLGSVTIFCMTKLSTEIYELETTGKAAASMARQIEGIDNKSIDIASLQLEEAGNGYKKVTFYYKISE